MADVTRRNFFLKMAAVLPAVYASPQIIVGVAHASSPSNRRQVNSHNPWRSGNTQPQISHQSGLGHEHDHDRQPVTHSPWVRG
jgi:hypothetical protein